MQIGHLSHTHSIKLPGLVYRASYIDALYVCTCCRPLVRTYIHKYTHMLYVCRVCLAFATGSLASRLGGLEKKYKIRPSHPSFDLATPHQTCSCADPIVLLAVCTRMTYLCRKRLHRKQTALVHMHASRAAPGHLDTWTHIGSRVGSLLQAVGCAVGLFPQLRLKMPAGPFAIHRTQRNREVYSESFTA
jgi:hypothetical protein